MAKNWWEDDPISQNLQENWWSSDPVIDDEQVAPAAPPEPVQEAPSFLSNVRTNLGQVGRAMSNAPGLRGVGTTITALATPRTQAAPQPAAINSVLNDFRPQMGDPGYDPMLNPQFVEGFRTELGSLPVENRLPALRQYVENDKSVYGRAARVILAQEEYANQKVDANSRRQAGLLVDAPRIQPPAGSGAGAGRPPRAVFVDATPNFIEQAQGMTAADKGKLEELARSVAAVDEEVRRNPELIESRVRQARIDSFVEENPTMGWVYDKYAAETLKGLGIGIKAFTDVFGAGNVASDAIESVIDGISARQSTQQKEAEQRRGEIMEEYADGGIIDQLKGAAKAFAVDPAGLMFNTLGIMGPMVLGGKVLAGTKAVQAIGAGSARLIGRAGSITAATTAGSAITGGVMGAGFAKGAIYDAVFEMAKAEGYTDADAKRIATKSQSYTENPDLIALVAVATAAGAGTGVEPLILNALGRESAKQLLKQGVIKSVAGSVLREVPLEMLQGGSEAFAANKAAQRAGFDIDPMRGVWGNAFLEGMASGGFAAGAGVAQSNLRLRDETRQEAASRALSDVLQDTDVQIAGGAEAQALRQLDPNATDPTLIDPRQTVRGDMVGPAAPATTRVTGEAMQATRVGDGTISFTPDTNLTVQAGLTPIVVPDPAITMPMEPTGMQPGDMATVTVPGALPQQGATQAATLPTGTLTRTQLGRSSDADLLARATAAAGPVDTAPVEQWFGRKGDGYLTAADAQQALPGRQRMFTDLNWSVEEMPNGKFRLAGYAQGATPAGVQTRGMTGVQDAATITPATDAQQRPQAAQEVTATPQETTLGTQTTQAQQAEAQGQQAAAAVPAAVTGQQFIADPALATTADTITFAPGQIGALKVSQRRDLNQAFTSQEMDDGSVIFTRTDAAPIDAAGDQGQRAARPAGAQAVDSPLSTGVVQTLNDASLRSGKPQRFTAVAPEQTAQAGAAMAIAKTFSKPVVFVRATGGRAGFNAYYDPSFDGIVINADSRRPMFTAVLHEVGHSMPTDIRKSMVDAVLQTVTPEQRARFKQEFPFYNRYSEEVQNEELVMRIIEQDAENPALWQRMADRMGDTAFARFARDLVQVLDKLMASFTREDSREFTSDIERVRDIVADAYAQTLERMGQDPSTLPDGVRASAARKPKAAGDFSYTTDDKGRINVAGDVDRIRFLAKGAATGTPNKDGSGVTFRAENASAVVKALKNAPKADPRIASDIAEQLGLSDAELASTSLEFQTGKPGERAFSTPLVGGIPETVQFLENRRRESGLPVLDIASPENQDTLAKLIAAETLAAIRSSGNALEWYNVTIARTLAMASVKYPELANDANAQMSFRLAMAIASQGLNVENNLKLAMRRYEEFRNTGKFPEVGEGESAEAMAGNFRLANELVEEMGTDLFRSFLATPFTIGELNSAGFEPGGELVTETVLGSSVFGPKIGFGFYSNLNGNFEPVTMDMWFMRTMGRLTGNLRAFDETKFAGQLQRFRDAFEQTGTDGVYANRFDAGLIDSARTDQEAAVTLARQVKKAHEKDFKDNRAAFDAKQRKKTGLVLAAETMIMSVDKPKDVPSSGTERRLLREVVRKSVDLVADAYGQRVPPAAMQALIWYPEQELYKAMGVKLSVTSQDYAGATEKVLKEEGYNGKQLRAAAQSGARRARQENERDEQATPQVDGQRAGRVSPLEGQERDQFIRGRFERTQLEQERLEPRRRGIVFEVAPDPNNTELNNRWNQLSDTQRLEASERVAREIVPTVLSEFNTEGILAPQVGSYIDQTNPSFTVLVNKGNAIEIAQTLGFVLAQDSMVVVSPKPFKGGEKSGAISLELGQQTPEQINDIYQSLREIRVGDTQPIGGQSYVNGVMTILNFSDVPTQQLAVLVDQKLNKGYTVMTRDVFAAFPEKESYDYGSAQNDGQGSRANIRRRARALRAEATAALERELAGITPATDGQRRLSVERAARPAEPARGPGARPDAADGQQVTGIHYGKRAGLSQLNGTSFGTGIRGAEQERLNQPGVDPRIKKRVYFYLTNNNADMPRPEIGLGVHVYRANLGNMYDTSRAPQTEVQRVRSLMADSSANAFEAAVLDAGYRGYVNREQGTAVALNADVPVAYEGLAEAGRMRDRTPERLVPRVETRTEGSDFVRRPSNEEMTGIVRARPALADAAPSFRLEFGEARVAQAEAAAADQVLADAGAAFRFGDGRMMSVDRGIGAALQARVDNDFDTLVTEYGALPGTNGGRLLDADLARELSPEYRQDKTRAAEVHDASSSFVQKLFEQRITQPHNGGSVVLMAGGAGAGKSSANTLLAAELSGAGTILDGTLSNYDKARGNIQRVLDSGRSVVVAYVYRDPVDSLTNGVLIRAMETGRTVPADALVKGHAESNATVRRLAKDFAGNEYVQLRVVDNSRGAGNAARVELSDITPVIESGLKERFINATTQEYEAGRISEAVYNATIRDAGTAAQVAGEDAPDAEGGRRTAGQGREPGGARYSVERTALGFYSELTNRIGDGPNQAPKDQWKAYIKGLQGKGVKADEVTWSGIEDWLELQEGKVKKADVLEYMNSNGVQVQEVVLADADKWVVRMAGDPTTYKFDNEADAERFVRDEVEAQVNDQLLPDDEYDAALLDARDRVIMYEPGEWMDVAKYESYTLPGGVNYREVLLTLPTAEQERGNRFREIESEMRTATTERYAELMAERTRLYDESQTADFKSSHFDQPNIVSHIRLNDRTGADGSKVLFVEEVQSDWGQEGKKRGFQGKPTGANAEYQRLLKQFEDGTLPDEKYDRFYELQDSLGGGIQAEQQGSIPIAPFVNKTDGWVNLSLKRIMTIAVEGDYDKVAFVTGQQAVDRYSLSKQVDRVEYFPESKTLVAVRSGSPVITESNVNADRLEALIGKEAAQRMLDRPTVPAQRVGETSMQVLEGEALKVGGTGMLTFYDKIVPNALNTLLKKTSSKLETVEIGNRAEDFDSMDLDNATDAELAQLEQAGQVVELRQPGFEVTDTMRDKVRVGLPLFSAERGEQDGPGIPPIDEEALPGSRQRDTVQLDQDGLITENPRLSNFDRGLKRGVNVLGLFESATDKLRRSNSPVLKEMATRVDRYFDQVEARNGKFNGRLRPAMKSLKANDMQVFEQYWRDFDNGRKNDAEKLLAANPKVLRLVRAVKNGFDEAGADNQRVGVKVFDGQTNEWRPIGKARDFWPRVIRPEISQELESAGTTNPELWGEMLDALIKGGYVQNKEEASKYIRNYFAPDSISDYFAGIEKARGQKLPEMFYDYSWEVVANYTHRWAQRISQIENFGQVTGPGTVDFFDKVKGRIIDRSTGEYITAIQQRVYDVRHNTVSNNLMANLNMIATGTQLGNPATAVLNMIGGSQLNVQMFGPVRMAKGYFDLMQDYEAIMQEGTELGILGKDTMMILKDNDIRSNGYLSDEGRLAEGLRGFTSFTMKWGGYNATEQLIRANAFLAARGQLQDALQAWQNKPNSINGRKYTAFMERNRIDKDALIRENGVGEETSKYLRLMVNIPQGSYRIDQTPVYVDTPVGRFFFKYQKFGTQVSRLYWEQNLKPMLDILTGKSKESILTAFNRNLRWFGAAMIGGTAVLAARSTLFGMMDPGPDDEELLEALKSDDNGFKMLLLFERAWASLMAGSAFGFFGNYMQMVRDVSDRQRVKDPTSPPGFGPLITVKEGLLRLYEQGKLTPRDIDDLATQAFALYRSNKRLAASASNALDLEIREFQIEQARRDVAYVRKVARWYAKDNQLEGRMTTATRFGSSANTPINRKIYEALILNDPDRALDLAQQERDSIEDMDEWKRRRQSILSAMRTRHPANISQIRNREDREEFLNWSMEKLPPGKQRKILDLVDNYESNIEMLRGGMPP